MKKLLPIMLFLCMYSCSDEDYQYSGTLVFSCESSFVTPSSVIIYPLMYPAPSLYETDKSSFEVELNPGNYTLATGNGKTIVFQIIAGRTVHIRYTEKEELLRVEP